MTPPFAPLTRGFRRTYLTLLLAMVASAPLSAQELDCQVSVIAPTVNNVETSVFEQLETAITEFMNGRRWTTDEFTLTERVTCTMQITINKANSQTNFEGTIQVRLLVKVQAGQQWVTARELRARIKRRFDAEGIRAPYQHRVVHHMQVGPDGETKPITEPPGSHAPVPGD